MRAPRAALGLLGLLGLGVTACLVTENPNFLEPGASETDDTNGESGADDESGANDCDEGFLDCDDAPGCEASVSDPLTCGACDNSCAIAGQMLECAAGQCSGPVEYEVQGDTYVSMDEPDLAFGSAPTLEVDLSDGLRTFIEIPGISDIPADATIQKAELVLNCTNTGAPVAVHRVLTAWDEQTLTWLTAPAVDSPAAFNYDAPSGMGTLDLLPLISAWREGTPNHGIALLPTGGDTDGVAFTSRETNTPPRVILTLSWGSS